MGQGTHKQAMLPMRGRRMLAELVLCQGWPIPRAAQRMNVARPTARQRRCMDQAQFLVTLRSW